MSEDSIMLQARQGDEKAFRQLFHNNKESVFRLAYRYTRSQEDAEDIMQETFIKAFKNIKKFDNKNETSFSGWINRISINCSINHLRRNKSRKMDEMDSLSKLQDKLITKNPSEETTEINFNLSKIKNALQKLTHKQRIIFDMRFSQQMKIREIAEIMKCSDSNVKTQLFRTFAKLRKQLKPIWSEL